jgi:very-short-patch-repair endonuclease
MAEYPTVLIPDAIRQAQFAQPPTFKPLNLPIPIYPGDVPKRINKTLIVAESIITVILSSVIDNIVGGNLGTTLLIGGLGAIAAQTWRQFTTFPQRKKKRQYEIANHHQDKQKYERSKRLYYEQQKAKFKRDSVLKVLSKTIPPDGNQSTAWNGISEAKFSSYLKKYFGKNIYTKITLNRPNLYLPYSPDFAYIDRLTNLHIDIEIDEPYSYKDKNRKPIHYIDADSERNNFFLQRGWIIIRFTEEQVVCYPESCCRMIAEVITDLLQEDLILIKFKNIFPLPKRKQWTEDEAKEMARTDYRQTYLSRSRSKIRD